MKNLITYIKEQLSDATQMITEAFDSDSFKEFLLKYEKEKENYNKGYRCYNQKVNLHDGRYSAKQFARLLSAGNLKEEWFYTKNNKRIFDVKELCQILDCSENDLKDAQKLDKIASSKSTVVFIYGTYRNYKLETIDAAMLFDPKHGKESYNYLKQMYQKKETRKDNYWAARGKDNDVLANNSDNITEVNNIIKQYQKVASKQQIDALTKGVNQIMKYARTSKGYKDDAKKWGSKQFNNYRSNVTYYILSGMIKKLCGYIDEGGKFGPIDKPENKKFMKDYISLHEFLVKDIDNINDIIKQRVDYDKEDYRF